jgi:CNT family concentrative nucleoside transporter
MSQETPAMSRSHTEPVIGIDPTPLTHDDYEGKDISPYAADEKKLHSSPSLKKEHHVLDAAVLDAKEEADIEADRKKQAYTWRRTRPFFLTALALLILGWWISATVLPATRHRWCVPGPRSYGVSLMYTTF